MQDNHDGNKTVALAKKLSRIYVARHARLTQEMWTLHRARTLLEMMW